MRILGQYQRLYRGFEVAWTVVLAKKGVWCRLMVALQANILLVYKACAEKYRGEAESESALLFSTIPGLIRGLAGQNPRSLS
jgi:hypothetical protein